jgi:WD40 repeat-containing protein SMU1
VLLSPPIQIISGSSDGTVRVWDAKTTDCLRFFSPSGAGRHITELTSIHSLVLSPLNPEYIIVGSKSNTVHLMNLKVTLFHHCLHLYHHRHLLHLIISTLFVVSRRAR